MRKPVFCICENKDADQLISAFVFPTLIAQSLYFLNTKFFCSCTDWFVWDLVGNPEDPFSHNEAQLWEAVARNDLLTDSS